jgi:hypothetical protein
MDAEIPGSGGNHGWAGLGMLGIYMYRNNEQVKDKLHRIANRIIDDIENIGDPGFGNGLLGVSWFLSWYCDVLPGTSDAQDLLFEIDDLMYQRLLYVNIDRQRMLEELAGHLIYLQHRMCAAYNRTAHHFTAHHFRSMYDNIAGIMIIDKLTDLFSVTKRSAWFADQDVDLKEAGHLMLFLSWYTQNNFILDKAEKLLFDLSVAIEHLFEDDPRRRGRGAALLALCYLVSGRICKQAAWIHKGSVFCESILTENIDNADPMAHVYRFLISTALGYPEDRLPVLPNTWDPVQVITEQTIINQFLCKA